MVISQFSLTLNGSSFANPQLWWCMYLAHVRQLILSEPPETLAVDSALFWPALVAHCGSWRIFKTVLSF